MVRLVTRPDVNAGPPQVVVDDRPRYWSGVRHGDEGLAHDVLWVDHLVRSKAVIARQHGDEAFRGDDLEHQITCPCFSSQERHVELALDESIREVGRILT